MQRASKRHVVFVAIVCSVVVSACSANQPPDNSDSSTVLSTISYIDEPSNRSAGPDGDGVRTTVGLATPSSSATVEAASTVDTGGAQVQAGLDAMREIVKTNVKVRLAQGRAISNCMRQAGFDILPYGEDGVTSETQIARANIDGTDAGGWLRSANYHFPNADGASPTPEFAAKYGYGIFLQFEVDPQVGHDSAGNPVAVDPFYQQPQDYQFEYFKKLTGLDTINGSNARVLPESETCEYQVEAKYRFNSSVLQDDQLNLYLTGPTGLDGYKQFGANPAWAHARDGWLSCMNAKGYTGLTDILAARTVYGTLNSADSGVPAQAWAPADSWFTNSEVAKKREIEVATADAQCAEANQVNQAYLSGLNEWRADYILGHPDQIQSALDWARHVAESYNQLVGR